LILVPCNWAEDLEWPPLRSGHFQRFYICKPAKPAGFAGLLFHGKGRDRTLHFCGDYAFYLWDSFCEKMVWKRPQSFPNHNIK
jgi:hypothetical protein